MSRAGLLLSDIWRADLEGKRNETLLLSLKGQCETDAEEISAQSTSVQI